MITATNGKRNYIVDLTNGTTQINADVTSDKGGEGLHFRPHELLASAYAACLNISVRMILDRLNLSYSDIRVDVDVDRTTKGKTIFRSNIIIDGDLTEEQKQMAIDLAAECPVHKTLSNEIEFDTLK